jgi:hypothetical protein
MHCSNSESRTATCASYASSTIPKTIDRQAQSVAPFAGPLQHAELGAERIHQQNPLRCRLADPRAATVDDPIRSPASRT